MSDTAGEKEPAEDTAAPAKIDFDRAEMEDGAAGGVTCALCQSPIHAEYWQIIDKVVCETCRDTVQQSAAEANGTRAFARAALQSGLVALGCGIGYAVFAGLTKIHFALITIGIGWVVGRAVQKVTRGFGTVKHQVLAVVLTYCASAMGYLPAVLSALTHNADRSEQTTAATSTAAAPSAAPAEAPSAAPAEASPAPAAGAATTPEKTGLSFAVALVVFTFFTTALTLAAPILELTSGFSGLLGALIIFFGLQQAWRISAGVSLLVTGPHRLTHTASS